MNDENKYEPYDYGKPLEQKQESEIDHMPEGDVGSEEEKEELTPTYNYSYEYRDTQQSNNQKKPTRKGNSFAKVVGFVVLAILLGGISAAAFQGSNYLLGMYLTGDTDDAGMNTNPNKGNALESTQISTGTGNQVESNVADVAEQVMPSVVSITSMSIQEVQTFPFGAVQEYEVPSSGSGIIIGQNTSEVLVVTNNHVVQGSKTLTIIWNDGTSTEATVRGTDPDRDLAIIAVPLSSLKEGTVKAIKVATLGNSELIRVGEPAIAIGNALGYGQSVTLGIVSAVGRTLEGSEGQWIQTDAAINPGNSGGALLNANGEVIGINTAKVNADAVEGMGYAIPISDVTDVLESLINQEARVKVPESERGELGIRGVDVTSSVASWYNIPIGVYVTDVVHDSGADKADIPVYSVITEINGRDVENLEELQEELSYYRVGEKVTVTCYVQVKSKYEAKEYKVTLQ